MKLGYFFLFAFLLMHQVIFTQCVRNPLSAIDVSLLNRRVEREPTPPATLVVVVDDEKRGLLPSPPPPQTSSGTHWKWQETPPPPPSKVSHLDRKIN
ncbi:hypothetical protein C2S52_006819 [Perilla frutescens var. hirtella]|nr:hypothetical protein C2S52_006819 [Perilla frutescens var. hirtella]